jgi:sugar phosphate isomerase/epimerase
VPPDAPDPARLSLNQATTQRWSLAEAVAGCRRAGVGWIGVWRDKLPEDARAGAALVRAGGLRVSSLCRGGFFPAATAAERRRRLDDNRRALDEAAALGAEVLVLVCGPAPDRDLDGARAMVADGIAELDGFARDRGVKLGIEPLHPMFAGDRSVIVTLAQANDLAERLGSPQVGVIVDVYHVWWDPRVYEQIARAAGRILGFHVSDWLAPPPDVLLGRGLMGDGLIELRRLRRAVEAAGYAGPIEVEIFNQTVWDTPGDEVLAQIKERFLAWV